MPKPRTSPSPPRRIPMTFSTGDVSKMLGVAPRTVTKWFDSGKLKGFLLPGSSVRRIPQAYLLRFLLDHNLPLDVFGVVARYRILAVGMTARERNEMEEASDGWAVVRFEDSMFAAGVALSSSFVGPRGIASVPDTVVLNFSLGRSESINLGKLIKDKGVCDLVAIVEEDDSDLDLIRQSGDFSEVYQKPGPPMRELMERLKERYTALQS